MLDWDNLRVFLTAVRAGNYTVAAQRLSVDRTTVGRRIERLERQLGVPLFEVGEDGYHPTPAGREALEIADAMEQLTDRLRSAIAGQSGAARSPLRVAVSAELGSELMAELAAFADLHPEISLRITSSGEPGDHVVQRKSDIAIALADARPEHLRGRRVGVLRQAPYATVRYLDRRGHGLPPQAYEWIRATGWSQLPMMRRWDAIFCDTVQVAAFVDGWSGLRRAVEENLGAAFLWTFAAEGCADLRQVAPCDEKLGADLWLLVRDDVPMDRPTRAFMDDLAVRLADRLKTA